MNKNKWLNTKENPLNEDTYGILINCKYRGFDDDEDSDDYCVEIGYFKDGTFFVSNNGDYMAGGYGQDYEADVIEYFIYEKPNN